MEQVVEYIEEKMMNEDFSIDSITIIKYLGKKKVCLKGIFQKNKVSDRTKSTGVYP